MLKLESVNTDLSLSIEHDHEIAAASRNEHIAAKIHSTTMGAATATQRPAKTIAGTGNPHC